MHGASQGGNMIQKLILIAIMSVSFSAMAKPWGANGQNKKNFRTETILKKKTINGTELVRMHALINQKLKAQGQNPADYQLEGVTLFAKSWGGNATATLMVGQDQSTKVIPRAKNFAFFLINEPYTYNVLTWDLQNGPGQDSERWQMRFSGNIVVDELQIHISSRGRVITIPMGDQLFTNQTLNTVMLRQELQQMGINSQNFNLRGVRMLAKSQAGQATAQLRIGQNYKPAKVVQTAQPGFNFQDQRPASYNLIEWRQNGPTPGVWQILLNGRVKIKSIVVELE